MKCCNEEMLNEITMLLCFTKDLSKGMSCIEYVGEDDYDYTEMAIAAFALMSDALDKAHSIAAEM